MRKVVDQAKALKINPNQGKKGRGMEAATNIKAGWYLAEFKGVIGTYECVTTHFPSDADIRCLLVDKPEKIYLGYDGRDLEDGRVHMADMFNDIRGKNNCKVVSELDGAKYRAFLVATEDIPCGSALGFDYDPAFWCGILGLHPKLFEKKYRGWLRKTHDGVRAPEELLPEFKAVCDVAHELKVAGKCSFPTCGRGSTVGCNIRGGKNRARPGGFNVGFCGECCPGAANLDDPCCLPAHRKSADGNPVHVRRTTRTGAANAASPAGAGAPEQPASAAEAAKAKRAAAVAGAPAPRTLRRAGVAANPDRAAATPAKTPTKPRGKGHSPGGLVRAGGRTRFNEAAADAARDGDAPGGAPAFSPDARVHGAAVTQRMETEAMKRAVELAGENAQLRLEVKDAKKRAGEMLTRATTAEERVAILERENASLKKRVDSQSAQSVADLRRELEEVKAKLHDSEVANKTLREVFGKG